jgi:hypothetical protein
MFVFRETRFDLGVTGKLPLTPGLSDAFGPNSFEVPLVR